MQHRPATRTSAGVVAALLAASGIVSVAAPAGAATLTADFNNRGCSTWTVPSRVTSVQAEAVGARGNNSGGLGDGVTATISVTPGQSLRVCVDIVRNSGGNTIDTGGGASGVALGTDFSVPLIVAAGGGGGGGGGNAGFPSGAAGSDGAGGGTQTAGGAGGSAPAGFTSAEAGAPGAGFTAGGPGLGGGGGLASAFDFDTGFVAAFGNGGGNGYFGGGGGGAGISDVFGPRVARNGGGGSDYCGAGRPEVSDCVITSGAGTRYGSVGVFGGSSRVRLSWPEPPTEVAPTIDDAIDDIFVVATAGSCSAVVDAPTVSASGIPEPVVSFTSELPGSFDVGSTTVTATATNGVSPDATALFDVTVVDDEDPALGTLPADMTVEATGPSGAVVTYGAISANDNCPGVSVESSPASGSVFPLGTTQVQVTARDRSANFSVESFSVTVRDTTAPTITLVSVTPAANAAGWNNSTVTVRWSCSDAVGVLVPEVLGLLGSEGAGQGATGECRDTVANSSFDTVGGIDIDLTAPSLAPVVSPNPIPVGTTAVVEPNASDALSGLASVSCGAIDTAAAATKSVTCTAVDVAGNSTTATVFYDVVLVCGTVSGTPGQLTEAGYRVRIGGRGPDTITGTNGNDFILGGGGNDTLNGLGGNDVICGEVGDDIINGGSATDVLDGGRGRDTIDGGTADDTVLGGPGNDVLRGGDGTDKLYGEDDNDSLIGGNQIDTCDGGLGTDTGATCETSVRIP